MESADVQSLSIAVNADQHVSALLQAPRAARAGYVLAHGAGAGMQHPFMAVVAAGLAERGIATMRYQFPYVERGARRPDSPQLAQRTVRAAVTEASRRLPELPLFAGGKSYGGRMTSQAQAESPLPGVRGLIFLGFPLHPAERPSDERAQHLVDVHVPMLFLQGTRDQLAEVELLRSLVGRLGPLATLRLLEGADHSFHVPARTGRTDKEVLDEMLDTVAVWTDATVGVRR